MKFHFTVSLAVGLLLPSPTVPAAELALPVADHSAPPPLPPVMVRLTPPAAARRTIGLAATPQLYSIGDPTDEEQFYLELLNRSRMNPIAEAGRLQSVTDSNIRDNYDYFQVDLNLLASQYAVIAPAPPLSFNSILVSVARVHSQDMLENNFQDHYGFKGCPATSPPCEPATAPGGITDRGCCLPFDRMTEAGYIWSRAAENVFAYAKSVLHGHASFEVDWGGTSATGGMQDPPGHRENIHNRDYREIGVGVVLGSNLKVGPQLVTQVFGTSFEATPFVTGVAYYDLNGNGFYDPGEGIGGVKVTIPGAAFCAVTSKSGGYSVPVTRDGNYVVTFSLPGMGDIPQSATVVEGKSVKVDFMPPYPSPTVSGGKVAYLKSSNLYGFTLVGAATAYQWQQTMPMAWTNPEGAEAGAGAVTALTTPGYSIVTADAKFAGSFSFHLTHLPNQPEDQSLKLNRDVRVNANSELVFYSRLTAATTNQLAQAQISTNGGRDWQTVWSQRGAGLGHIGELAFTKRTLPLTSYASSVIQIRFLYSTDGAYFVGTQIGTGFYVDDIVVTNAEELTNPVLTNVASGTNFVFTPSAAIEYALRVRPQVSGKWLDFGSPFFVSAKAGVPVTNLKVTSLEFLTDGRQILIEFDVLAGNTGNFQLESAPTPTGPWTTDDTASLLPTSSDTRFQILSSRIFVGQRFYRVAVH